jgi:hypothetical protein
MSLANHVCNLRVQQPKGTQDHACGYAILCVSSFFGGFKVLMMPREMTQGQNELWLDEKTTLSRLLGRRIHICNSLFRSVYLILLLTFVCWKWDWETNEDWENEYLCHVNSSLITINHIDPCSWWLPLVPIG